MRKERKYLILSNEIKKLEIDLNKKIKDYENTEFIEIDLFYFPNKLIVLIVPLFLFIASFFMTTGLLLLFAFGFTILFFLFLLEREDLFLSSKIQRLLRLKKMKKDKRYRNYIFNSRKSLRVIEKKRRDTINEIKKINNELNSIESNMKEEIYIKEAVSLLLSNDIPCIAFEVINDLNLNKTTKDELEYIIEKRVLPTVA